MDQITAFFESIDWNAILDTVMTKLTDLIVQIDFQQALDAIASLVAGFIAP